MRNLSPLHMATRLRRAVREISSALTLMPHPQSVPFYSSCIAIMYSNYLMLFLTWAVSSFWQPFETSQVSLSKAIRYNAPWQPAPAFTLSPEEDVADQGLGKHALHHHLGHHRLLPHCWQLRDGCLQPQLRPWMTRMGWGDPVVISEPSDSGRHLLIWSQRSHLCTGRSVSWISVWPGALNFGDAVRCQTGYMQVAKAGNRQWNIAKRSEPRPMKNTTSATNLKK